MQPELRKIPVATLSSGDRLFLQLYRFAGYQPGKKVYIQSNLHGAEIAGNAVIHLLIDYLQSLQPEHLMGEVWLVPGCNPLGMNERSHHFSSGRFNPYDGKDWNRIFWDYEKSTDDDLLEFAQINLTQDTSTVQRHYRKKILEAFTGLNEKITAPSSVPFREKFRYALQSLCIDADYVIDLHSSTNQGINYLYYFHKREDSAKYFLMPVGIELDVFDGDAFDEAFLRPWLVLEEQFAKLGRDTRFDVESYTLELGSGMQMNADSIAKGLRGVKNYLVNKQVLTIPDYPIEPPPYHDMRFTASSKVVRYYAPVGGLIQDRVPLGRMVNKGDRLYDLLCLNKEGGMPSIVTISAGQDGLVFDVSTNQAVNEGEYVLGIL